MFNLKKKNRGFTMIEAFVAITVLLVAVLGPLTLITRAIIDGNYAKYQVTASFLMQEGLDLAVARAAELSDSDNISVLDENCLTLCRISADVNGNILIESTSDLNLYTDGDGTYSHNSSGGTKTIFSRKIWFEDVSDGSSRSDPIPGDLLIGKKVFVQLDWAYHGLSRSQIATTIVYE
ncbi:MAG: hypothetical protein A2556_00260 [Candidatus Vogelbacteria bacterium RIFOXYD2_FULL_44_9]|uniref:Prepilin-type N-terminal cleavage/methylation domain-containing protein n=1 Tax=Candidatus Vogelbacteria bacterium RIFOXYD2_FULL_44_9 TaxID=1802441 RepID=A0A1G2QJ75_9BACT|nr:MAG: hypothetical protein A2556_00260 [Candidatus Vogelbacteria bacterium RIFOXYD2_FULL_44_9]